MGKFKQKFKFNLQIFLLAGILILLAVNAVLLSRQTNKPVDQNYNYVDNNPSEVIVTKIIDGDTIIVSGGRTIRLLDIDAPEKDEACYAEAKKRLSELILGEKVKLEAGPQDKDRYGRWLRYIFLGEDNINLELVKEGLAVARFFQTNSKYQPAIKKAEFEAQKQKIGCLWQKNSASSSGQIINWQKLTSAKTGLKIIKACQANKYIGSTVIVQGKIADTYQSKTKTIFLNFGQPYPQQCFNAVIFPSDLGNFPPRPQEVYLGQTVRIKSRIKEYRGRPEIILKTSEQIEVGE